MFNWKNFTLLIIIGEILFKREICYIKKKMMKLQKIVILI